MARKYIVRSKEEKLSIVKRNLSGETAKALARELDCSDRQVRNWTKAYLAEGETGLEVKRKPGNPLAQYERRKELTYKDASVVCLGQFPPTCLIF